MMERVLLWGNGCTYLQRKQLLKFEIYKKNIECVALCAQDYYAKCVDNIPVIKVSDVMQYSFEWVLVFSDGLFREIRKEAISMGVSPERILNSRCLTIKDFDFSRYVSLITNPISIVTRDCLAAKIYHYLGLQFTSPFILYAFTESEEFYRVCNNLDYYLNKEIVCLKEADIKRAEGPFGVIGEGEKAVNVDLLHYSSVKEANEAWIRRKQRINYQNILYICRVVDENERREFESIPSEKKVAFTTDKNLEGGKIHYLPRYTYMTQKSCRSSGYSFAAYLREIDNMAHSIDLLKLLTGDEDYMIETPLDDSDGARVLNA